MTVAIIGGEGSVGKTSVLNLLAQHIALEGKPTLYIDANPDQNGLEFGGVSDAQRAGINGISNGMEFLTSTLEGHNPLYRDHLDHVISTSPVTDDSGFWTADRDDPVMQKFAVGHDGISFMQTGSFTSEDAGIACSHDKIGPLVFMLQRLDDGLDGKQATALIDYAHGEDGFGTPLYPQSDLVIVVARPNKKSRDIMANYLRLAEQIGKDIGHNVEIAVVANQLSTDPVKREQQVAYLKEVAGDHYVAGLTMDPVLEREFENTAASLSELKPENQHAIALLAARIDAAQRVPERKQAWLHRVHAETAPWYDKMLDADGAIAAQNDHAGHTCGHGCNHHHHHHR